DGRGETPAVLAARSFPDDESRLLTQQVKTGQVKPVLEPGMAVAVRVSGGAPPDDPTFTQRITETIKGRLQRAKLKPDDAGQVTMTVTINGPQGTGKEERIHWFGGRKPDTIIAINKVD